MNDKGENCPGAAADNRDECCEACNEDGTRVDIERERCCVPALMRIIVLNAAQNAVVARHRGDWWDMPEKAFFNETFLKIGMTSDSVEA
jgi:hypothetical protein